MKKTAIIIMMLATAFFPSVLNAGTPISQSTLPSVARTFISKYFPGEKIRKAEKEQGHRGTEYEVDLTSGAEVCFRDNGEWKEVKAARGKSVPAAVVPAAISRYVATHHKGNSIVEISRKRGGYKLELSNGTELHLTAEAKPMTGRRSGKRDSR